MDRPARATACRHAPTLVCDACAGAFVAPVDPLDAHRRWQAAWVRECRRVGERLAAPALTELHAAAAPPS